MDRDAALGLLDRLHAAQNEFYAGGSGAALRTLLASDVTWIVPGRNRIAGTYRGLTEVLGYFERRRNPWFHLIGAGAPEGGCRGYAGWTGGRGGACFGLEGDLRVRRCLILSSRP